MQSTAKMVVVAVVLVVVVVVRKRLFEHERRGDVRNERHPQSIRAVHAENVHGCKTATRRPHQDQTTEMW